MAVYIFSTGSISTAATPIAAGETVTVTVDNRTTQVQTFRADLYDTSNGRSPKVLLASQPIATIGPNGGVSFLLTSAAQAAPPAPSTVSAFEIEVRVSNEHMAANVITASTGVILTALTPQLPILPNEFFRNSDIGGSV
jgi:hypothetical protein